MIVRLSGKPVSAAMLSRLGFAVLSLARAMEREEIQRQQAMERPTLREIVQAGAAAESTVRNLRSVQAILREHQA